MKTKSKQITTAITIPYIIGAITSQQGAQSIPSPFPFKVVNVI